MSCRLGTLAVWTRRLFSQNNIKASRKTRRRRQGCCDSSPSARPRLSFHPCECVCVLVGWWAMLRRWLSLRQSRAIILLPLPQTMPLSSGGGGGGRSRCRGSGFLGLSCDRGGAACCPHPPVRHNKTSEPSSSTGCLNNSSPPPPPLRWSHCDLCQLESFS